jgi:hypothetical protein
VILQSVPGRLDGAYRILRFGRVALDFCNRQSKPVDDMYAILNHVAYEDGSLRVDGVNEKQVVLLFAGGICCALITGMLLCFKVDSLEIEI